MTEHNGIAGGPPETGRRGFLKWMVGALAAAGGLVLSLPFLTSLIGTGTAGRKAVWSRVSAVDRLPLGRPVEVRFETSSEEAFLHGSALNSVWVVLRSANDATVFSPICTHLGCHFGWNQEHGRFECPCHASVFALDGTVVYGPAPRPLDTLPAKIEKGVLYVRWERFRVGTPEKTVI